MFKIMVVDDDHHTRRLMEAIFTQNGYECILARNGLEARAMMDMHHVDLILLDVMMPEIDGYTFARQLREEKNTMPILMVSALETSQDIKAGFRSGSDDYMVKPVDEEELMLRIQALLRRSQIVNERKLLVNQTLFDFDSFSVISKDMQEVLPRKEFLLIYKLLSDHGKILTRRQLMDELWDLDSESDERTIDVHIKRLRDKFKDNHDFEIQTIRGLGYKAMIL